MDWGAAGMFTMGLSSLFSAFGGGGSPPQMSPEMQAALEQQGVDIQKFTANVSAAMTGLSLPFEQELSRYPLQLQQALGNAYTEYYGDTERAAIAAAEKAFAGEMTPATKNLITAYSANVAGQKIAARNALKANIAAAGMDMSSPEAQAILAQQEASMSSSLSKGTADIAFQAGQQDIQNALKTLQLGQTSERLAGTQYPGMPATGTERLLEPLMNEINALNEQLRSGNIPTAQANVLKRRLDYLNQQATQIKSGNLFGTVPQTMTAYTPNLEQAGAFGAGGAPFPGTSSFSGGGYSTGGGAYSTNALSGSSPVFNSYGSYGTPSEGPSKAMQDYNMWANMTYEDWTKVHPDAWRVRMGKDAKEFYQQKMGDIAKNDPRFAAEIGYVRPVARATPNAITGIGTRYAART